MAVFHKCDRCSTELNDANGIVGQGEAEENQPITVSTKQFLIKMEIVMADMSNPAPCALCFACIAEIVFKPDTSQDMPGGF